MSVTNSLVKSFMRSNVAPGMKIQIQDLAFDSSYPTGGETLDPASFGMAKIHAVFAAPASGYIFEFDADNTKLKAFYFDYDAGADGAAIQVANEADLASVTTRALIVGS